MEDAVQKRVNIMAALNYYVHVVTVVIVVLVVGCENGVTV